MCQGDVSNFLTQLQTRFGNLSVYLNNPFSHSVDVDCVAVCLIWPQFCTYSSLQDSKSIAPFMSLRNIIIPECWATLERWLTIYLKTANSMAGSWERQSLSREPACSVISPGCSAGRGWREGVKFPQHLRIGFWGRYYNKAKLLDSETCSWFRFQFLLCWMSTILASMSGGMTGAGSSLCRVIHNSTLYSSVMLICWPGIVSEGQLLLLHPHPWNLRLQLHYNWSLYIVCSCTCCKNVNFMELRKSIVRIMYF